jgi:dTDP-4-amino-4,6-dideoxygalactose transaminase
MIPSVCFPFTFLDNLKIITGIFSEPKVKFMHEFRAITGHQYYFDVSSGRACLQLILTSLKNIHPEKNEVLISAMTCESVYTAVRNADLVPVFYDIDKETFSSDANDVSSKMNGSTLAVVTSSLYGVPAKLDILSIICRKKNVFCIEDNAHVLGIGYNGKITGNFGDVCFYSFGPSKTISMISGGMVCTNDDRIANMIEKYHVQIRKDNLMSSISTLIKQLIFYIITKPFIFKWLHYLKNEFKHHSGSVIFRRMNRVHYSIGLIALSKLGEVNLQRRANSSLWTHFFSGFNMTLQPHSNEKSFIRFPIIPGNQSERDNIISIFRQCGIWAVKSIFHPVHGKEDQCEVANYIDERLVLLPTGLKIPGRKLKKIKSILQYYETEKNQE